MISKGSIREAGLESNEPTLEGRETLQVLKTHYQKCITTKWLFHELVCERHEFVFSITAGYNLWLSKIESVRVWV